MFSLFYIDGDTVKLEIDIVVNKGRIMGPKYAVELKFPGNGQHPEQMFSFAKDIMFMEQLKKKNLMEPIVSLWLITIISIQEIIRTASILISDLVKH